MDGWMDGMDGWMGWIYQIIYQGGLLYLIQDIIRIIYHLRLIAQKCKSCIKGFKNCLQKLDALLWQKNLLYVRMIWVSIVVFFLTNVSHEGGMVAMQKALVAEKKMFDQILLLN